MTNCPSDRMASWPGGLDPLNVDLPLASRPPSKISEPARHDPMINTNRPTSKRVDRELTPDERRRVKVARAETVRMCPEQFYCVVWNVTAGDPAAIPACRRIV